MLDLLRAEIGTSVGEVTVPVRNRIPAPCPSRSRSSASLMAAMNELLLSYPSTITRGGSGPLVLTAPSRFLTELDDSLYERVVLEHEFDRLDDGEEAEDSAGLFVPWPRIHRPGS